MTLCSTGSTLNPCVNICPHIFSISSQFSIIPRSIGYVNLSTPLLQIASEPTKKSSALEYLLAYLGYPMHEGVTNLGPSSPLRPALQ